MKRLFLTLAMTLAFSNAHAMDVSKVNDLIAKTIKDAGAVGNVSNSLRVDLLKGKSTIEELKEGKIEVTKIDFNVAEGVFTAYVSANDNMPFEVSGRFVEITKLPVLSRKFSKNEIIGKTDIAYLEVESNKLKGNYVTHEEELIGKAPLREILKSRPVTVSQLTTPTAVERNKRITMVYSNNALKIQDIGIALENGAIGQTIKFKNANSNRVVLAKIMNEGLAQVQSANEVVASN